MGSESLPLCCCKKKLFLFFIYFFYFLKTLLNPIQVSVPRDEINILSSIIIMRVTLRGYIQCLHRLTLMKAHCGNLFCLLFVYGNESRVHLATGCDSGERRCMFGWFVSSREPTLSEQERKRSRSLTGDSVTHNSSVAL